MPHRRHQSVLTALILSVAAFSAAAATPVPESCLVCRKAKTDAAFVKCLSNCLDGETSEISLLPTAPVRPDIERWTFEKHPEARAGMPLRTVSLPSETPFRAHSKRIEPRLFITKDKDGPVRFYVNIDPAPILTTQNSVFIRIDNDPAMNIAAKTVNQHHAVLLDDEALLERLRYARRFRVTVEVKGGDVHTIFFDTLGIHNVLGWLEGEPLR